MKSPTELALPDADADAQLARRVEPPGVGFPRWSAGLQPAWGKGARKSRLQTGAPWLFVLVCAMLISSLPARAQFLQQGPKLVGTGGVGSAFQGYSVSLSADGNTAIVGGKYDNSNAGAAWVWTRSGAVWTPQGTKLVGSGAVRNAAQGQSVSISADGNTAIVGGLGDNTSVGAAWVWTRSGGVWSQQGTKLVASDTVGAAQQGVSVSLSADGNTAIVGANGDNNFAGAAWVWTRSGEIWTQGAKLVHSGAVGNEGQGQSVSLSADGNTAIVGAVGDNGGAGAAWVWAKSGGIWTQKGAKLVGSDALGPYTYQGASVSLSADGNTAIVGGDADNSSAGAAWVWRRSGGFWTQQGTKLVGSGAAGNAGQGVSVSLSADGNTAIVGAAGDNGGAGAAWVFTASASSVAPTIIVPPVSQTANAGQNANFTVTAIGTAPLSYQWRFNGVNLPGATSATLTLNSVGAGNAGGYSVVVSNPQGSATSKSATLAVLDNPTGGVTPPDPATLYPPVPAKRPAKDSLVVITHGWQFLKVYNPNPDLPDVSWIERMADSIRAKAPANWQVQAHNWLDMAWTPLPDIALNNAKDNAGPKLGDIIASQNWSHVHLIGHSAGAALIQAAAERIKLKSQNPVVVHTTFLDAYVGITGRERSSYGTGADWSDSYIAIDPETFGKTDAQLDNAYNVDVSWLALDRRLGFVNCSAGGFEATCAQAFSTHDWPYRYYGATIPPVTRSELEGFGFPLSKEGGGWDNRGNYPRGVAPRVLGDIPVPILSQGLVPVRSDSSLTLTTLLSVNSGNGTVQLSDRGLSFLTRPESALHALSKSGLPSDTGTPAWLSLGVPVTDNVNCVSFDAQFTSAAGAAGLLTVYWNTNQIGMVDESVALAGWHNYTFALPEVFEPGHYALGFSLNPFTNVVSGLTVTNVSTGYAGLTSVVRAN